MNLGELKPAPDYLTTAASRRAYTLNAGYRRLAQDEATGNYITWLENRAAQFVSLEDYSIVPCACAHIEILDEACYRGAPVWFCLDCNHLVRFSFSGNPIQCEAG